MNTDFCIYFQPIIKFGERLEILGHEALFRSSSGESIFSIISGLGEKDAIEFDNLCRSLAIRTAASLGLDALLFLNVSPSAAMDECFGVAGSLSLASDLGLAADRLVFELTENEAVIADAQFISFIQQQQKKNVKFALDDFGIGYAGLDVFIDLSPRFVKISRNIIKKMEYEKSLAILIADFVNFCRSRNCLVIAEGLEKYTELLAAHDAGIDLFQGYLFARPSRDGSFDRRKWEEFSVSTSH